MQQIRNIINHVEVRIIDNGSSDPIRAFYSIVDGESNGSIKSYIQVDVAFNNDNARGQIIGRAKQELKNWRDRYKVYTELHDVVNVIEPFIS